MGTINFKIDYNSVKTTIVTKMSLALFYSRIYVIKLNWYKRK